MPKPVKFCELCGTQLSRRARYTSTAKWCLSCFRENFAGKHLKGRTPWNKGKVMSKEYREKSSETTKKRWKEQGANSFWKNGLHPMKGLVGKKSPFYGTKASLETRIKQSLKKSGKETFDGFFNESRTINFKIRCMAEYKRWRLSILNRDNGVCVKCKSQKSLEVDHHPQSLGYVVKKNKIKSLEDALKCDILWDINNGRVLCKSCHERVHPLITKKLVFNSNIK